MESAITDQPKRSQTINPPPPPSTVKHSTPKLQTNTVRNHTTKLAHPQIETDTVNTKPHHRHTHTSPLPCTRTFMLPSYHAETLDLQGYSIPWSQEENSRPQGHRVGESPVKVETRSRDTRESDSYSRGARHGSRLGALNGIIT